jgi:hypothetical protein
MTTAAKAMPPENGSARSSLSMLYPCMLLHEYSLTSDDRSHEYSLISLDVSEVCMRAPNSQPTTTIFGISAPEFEELL